jgi:two-component system cell cycle sensor histidine kinase/response regulator CckA
VQDRAWLWILGLAIAIPSVVYFAIRAAAVSHNSDITALSVTVTVVLLGAVSAILLYRAGEQAAVSQAEQEAATANAELLTRISAERDRFAALVDHMPAGCIETDQEGRLIYANQTLADWLGCGPSELTDGSRRLDDILTPFKASDDEESASIDTSSDIVELEVVLLGVGGEVLHAQFSQTLVQAPGEPAYARAVIWNAKPVDDDQLDDVTGFKRLFEASPISLVLVGGDGRIIETSRTFRSLISDSETTVQGQPFIEVVDEANRGSVEQLIAQTLEQAGHQPSLNVRIGPLGDTIATLSASRLDGVNGEQAGVMLHLADTTEQKNLELQFAQSQKMQAVGQLAGGIAHDFNNLLTAMIGFCDLLLLRHQAGDPSFADLMQIKQNANRAASLVRQLLAFSRRQTLQPKVLALTDVLADLTNLLRRLIGENIELNMVPSRNLGLVKVDQGQMEQVIINLAVNARDAMAGGGKLTIRTSNLTHDAKDKTRPKLLAPGDYVLIEVGDSGTGIEKDLQGKIFEPFFSTKEVGAGTGLGLSTVYGIVKQTGGYVFVESEPGEGANFSIYLPRYIAPPDAVAEIPAPAKTPATQDLTGKGTILLVEDEDGVRVFGARALRNKGYTVIEANSGEAALAVMDSFDGDIDLLITDVVMPQMDGATLIERVRADHPDFKVILISGYAEDSFRERLAATEDVTFLPKPFSLIQLAGVVKTVIEA